MQANVFTEYAGLWALLGTLFSGVILAVVNKWLAHPKEEVEIAANLRTELRQENVSLKDQVKELNEQIQALHDELNDLRTQVNDLKLINQKLRQRLDSEAP